MASSSISNAARSGWRLAQSSTTSANNRPGSVSMRAVSSIAFSQIFEAEGARAAFGCSITPVFMLLMSFGWSCLLLRQL